MSKITLNSVADLTQTTTAQTTINANSGTVQTAFDNTLSRDGTQPNQMGSALDMNSNPIINLPAPASLNSPLRLQDLTSFIGGSLVIPAVPPAPTPSTLGGVFSDSAVTNQFVTNIDNTGTIHQAQPSFSNLSGTATIAQLPVATSSTEGIVQPDNNTITISGGVISAANASTLLSSIQGNFEFYNDGTVNGMVLSSYNGNNAVVWNTVTNSWVNFQLPPSVAVTNAANNGSGLIRITHAITTRPFVTGQTVYISGVVGVSNANTVPPVSGPYLITVIDSTHFDLQGSTFSGSYVSGGSILGSVNANVGNITINGTANQGVTPGTTYLVGLAFLDAACTVCQLVLSTNLTVPNHDPVMGFNTLAGYTNVPLVGMIYYDPALGVQGNGQCQLLISWYSRNMVGLQQTYAGTTGGAINTYVQMAEQGTGTQMKWLNWSDLSPNVQATMSITASSACSATVKIVLTGAINSTSTQQVLFTAAGTCPVSISIPIEAQEAGFTSLRVYLQTTASTVTMGTNSNAIVGVYTNF
jgi:hypothetical protein